MSSNDNSSNIKGTKNIIDEIVKNENPSENEIGNTSIQESNKEIKAPSSLSNNNQSNNQEVNNQDQGQDQNIPNNNMENVNNHNMLNQKIRVDYVEKIDNINRKMDTMGKNIADIKTGINFMNENIRKGFNNLAFTNYLIVMMLFLLISIIIYQIKNKN